MDLIYVPVDQFVIDLHGACQWQVLTALKTLANVSLLIGPLVVLLLGISTSREVF